MNTLRLSYTNFKDKPLHSFLSILLMALGIGIISLMLILGNELETKFKKNIHNTDMVVGAKGSPLQLILSAVYHIDSPTGNINLNEAKLLKKHPFVKWIVPLILGDNYEGHRIVGTDETFAKHYEAKIAKGKLFQQAFEVTIGSQVATNLNLKIGSEFESAHGFEHEGEKHHEKAFKVVGIFEQNNTVLDQLILSPMSSIWETHSQHNQGKNIYSEIEKDIITHQHNEEEEDENKITALLVRFRSPMGMMSLPRIINQQTNLQAALPAIEINRLFSLLGFGLDAVNYIAYLLILVAGISVFVSLYNSLKTRKYEIALMLSLGASKLKVFVILLLEGLIISILGIISGLIFSRIGLLFLSKKIANDFHYDLSNFSLAGQEWYLIFSALLVGFLAALLPSLAVFRVAISKTLSE
ncbi:MAG: ABC transporter permease [Pseudarcicella sp.]|nr:ABC transporter permease [Pseudarcicella sp.]